ncbi:MAG: hypothetical protein GDA44_03080 [Prochloron sp. SP5CPC1]|nr:hypothetical protein [Candidatus Paraprochloron terpiosi SP5CPC1]
MENPVIELVIFKAKEEISAEALKEAAAKTTPVLQKMDGFLDRELSIAENEEKWVDIVHWQNMNSAKKAAKAFDNEPDCQEFIAMIEAETITMLHCNSVLTSVTKSNTI